ncbi:MAG TPA: hypothetical protein VNC13_04925, partial [Propionibacteriaceae bacterium]|nr:hypothetical protein [Propionibacteriaceae bacterium]
MIMTLLCLGFAVLTAWLAVPRPAAGRLRARLEPAVFDATKDAATLAQERSRRRRSWTYVAIVIILLVSIIAAGYLVNATAAVLAGAALVVAATDLRLITQYRRRRSTLRGRADVAQASTVLVSYLRVGQVPSAALAIAAA